MWPFFKGGESGDVIDLKQKETYFTSYFIRHHRTRRPDQFFKKSRRRTMVHIYFCDNNQSGMKHYISLEPRYHKILKFSIFTATN